MIGQTVSGVQTVNMRICNNKKRRCKFNEKLKEDQLILEQKKIEEVLEERKDKFIKDMSDDEFDDMLQQLMEERKERKHKREKDFCS